MTATSYPFGPPERLTLHPEYARLRAEEPLARVVLPYGGEAWLATRYADIRTVLSDHRFSRAATIGADVPRVQPLIQHDPSILSMDPPEHTRLRRLVAQAFTGRHVERLRPRVQAVVDELLDAMIAAGPPGELTQSLNWPMSIIVICEMLGVPAADRDRFRAWTDLMLAIGDEISADKVQEATTNLNAYLAELIAARRAEPTDDLLSLLVQAGDAEDRLSERELITFGATLLLAGDETTANQTGSMVYLLLRRRDRWEQLVADPELVPQAVEELLRFIPLSAAAVFPRIAKEDVELGGRLVRAGEAVLVLNAAANRDPGVFDEPDEIDLSRTDNPHIAFGHGAHHCLGAPLARLELRIAIGTLVRRLPGLRLAVPADEVPWRANRLARGVTALPVEW